VRVPQFVLRPQNLKIPKLWQQIVQARHIKSGPGFSAAYLQSSTPEIGASLLGTNAVPPETRSTVIAITAQSVLDVTIFTMGGDNLISTHLCRSCGRLMGLARTIAASPGYSDLRTYGCRECGVWVTEGSAPGDQLKDTFIERKRPSFR
jgi:hypothetical protein